MGQLRFSVATVAVVLGLLGWVGAPALAQGGNNPPNIISLDLSTTPCDSPTLWTFEVNPCPWEETVLYACIGVEDLDWNDPNAPQQENQGAEMTMETFWAPYFQNGIEYGPQPPVIATDRSNQSETGTYFVAPPSSGQDVIVQLPILIPKFIGENQAKLRGLIDYDVHWLVLFTVFSATSQQTDVVSAAVTEFCGVQNPNLVPTNPPPFANAGGNQTIQIGTLARLDGSQSFDRSNTGFSMYDPQVFNTDTLKYQWEWISGPDRVDPQPDPDRPPAIPQDNWPISVVQLPTLTTPDNPYVYRLSVTDRVNATPSTDAARVVVVAQLPQVMTPHAAITVAPSGPVAVGTRVILSAAQSYDPDGSHLTYAWQQTNAIGGPLSASELESGFQALDGVNSLTATFVASVTGTFYFQLVVKNSGGLTDSALASVQVVAAPAPSSVRNPPTTTLHDVPPPAGATDTTPAPAGCGAGGMFPLILLPLALWLMRGRLR